jgi:spermidine/putrescine-binding protein
MDFGAELGVTRRDLLQRGAIATAAIAAPSVLAACGEESSEPSRSGKAVPGTVNYYSWQGEDFADQTKSWRQTNDVRLKSIYYSTPSEFEAKYLSGGGKGLYNLGTVCSCFGTRYQELDLLTPIDVEKVPNYEKLYPVFREGPLTRAWSFDGKLWGVPFYWGADALLYDSSKIETPASYEELLQPRLKNRFAFYDDPYGAVTVGARALGVGKPAEGLFSPRDLDEILAYLKPFKDNARVVTGIGGVTELFASREIMATTITPFSIINYAAEKGNRDVRQTIPAEGGYTWISAYIIPPDSGDVDTVLSYINHVLSRQVQAEGATALVAAVARPDAVPLLPKPVASLYPYDDIDSYFEQVPPLIHPPLEPDGDYVSFTTFLEKWEEFKSA